MHKTWWWEREASRKHLRRPSFTFDRAVRPQKTETLTFNWHVDVKPGNYVFVSTLFDQLEVTKLLIADLESVPDRLVGFSSAFRRTERAVLLSAFRAHLRSLRNSIQRVLRTWRSLDGPTNLVAAEITWFLTHGCHPPEPAAAFIYECLPFRDCASLI